MARTRQIVTIAVAALVLLAASCGSGADDSGGGSPATSVADRAQETGEVTQGGSVTFIVPGEPRSLDAAVIINSTVQGVIGNTLYGTLIHRDPITLEVVPGIAESLEPVDDTYARWTLQVRPGVRFSDGTPLDAEAVKFSWERLRDPALGSPSRGASEGLGTLTVTDELTLEIAPVVPNAHLVDLFGEYALQWIVSPTAVQAKGADFGTAPVGAGPFTLKEHVPGGRMVFERYQGYWNDPYPYLDEVTFLPNPDGAQSLDAITSGSAQGMIPLIDDIANQARDRGLTVLSYRVNGGTDLAFNTQVAPFDDVRARQAIAMAIDPELFVEAAFNGEGTYPETLMAPESPYYDPTLTFPWNQPAEAQRLFDELAAEGKPVNFTVTAFNLSAQIAAMDAIQTQLSQYQNVQMEVLPLDTAAATQRLVARDFQVITGGILAAQPEPVFYNAFRTGGSSNFSQYSDPAMDRVMDESHVTRDPAVLEEKYTQMQEIFIRDLPELPYIAKFPTVAYDADYTGYAMYGSGSIIFEQVGVKAG